MLCFGFANVFWGACVLSQAFFTAQDLRSLSGLLGTPLRARWRRCSLIKCGKRLVPRRSGPAPTLFAAPVAPTLIARTP